MINLISSLYVVSPKRFGVAILQAAKQITIAFSKATRTPSDNHANYDYSNKLKMLTLAGAAHAAMPSDKFSAIKRTLCQVWFQRKYE